MARDQWTHIKGSPGMGLEEQHLLRWQGVPCATLKPAPRQGPLPFEEEGKDRWRLSLLLRGGMSAHTTIVLAPLDRAKEAAEHMAREQGWKPEEAGNASTVAR